MMGRYRTLAMSLLLGGMVAALQVNAQGMRDPTVPPAAAGLGAATTGVQAPDFASDISSVIVRDGRRYLVQGSRLYGQGQQVGNTRIERITETAIWLREDGELRKQPLFPGIQLRVLPSNALPPAKSTSNLSAPLKTISPIAACALIHSHCLNQEIEKSAP